MAKSKKIKAAGKGASAGKSLTTAAGLARKLGVNRSTVTRRLKKTSGGGESKRIGHQFILDKGSQKKLSNRRRKK